jgi:HAD superfamily hydrolase (TIGR01509 family)
MGLCQNTMHQVKINPMTHPHPLSMKTVPDLATLKAGFPGLKTLLFDMDGTLFDTEKYHTMALQCIGRDQKIQPPLGPKELHELMMGKADHLLFELIKDWPGFPKHWDVRTFVNEKSRYLLEILNKVDATTYLSPAIVSLLNEAKKDGLQIGLVTSSEKIITNELLKFAKLDTFFDYVLTRDDSLKVKPDPWPYLQAMGHFNAQPETTLVFEDSLVGLEAGRGANAHLIKAEWY